MKTPSKKELQALAVRALGKDVEMDLSRTNGPNRPFAARAWVDDDGEVAVWHRHKSAATRALAAALRALAGEE